MFIVIWMTRKGHTMICPVDGHELLLTHREGIEIDYCPKCRGVWLDRGELDKLIEREAQRGSTSTREAIYNDAESTGYKRKNDDTYDDDYDDRRAPKNKRRGSFLEDIFDIFD
jgi:Zn-finger nucleic acid-binding protein